MDKLTEIQMTLKDVPCPRCYQTKLQAALQAGEAGDAPTYTAHCAHCGYAFTIDGHRPTWESLEEKVRRRITKDGCPRCGSNRLELNYRCALESKQCFHVASCQNCKVVFVVEKPGASEQKPPILDM